MRHLREHPGDPDAMHLWGVIEHFAGRHDAAVRAIESAVAQRPDVAVFHNSLGVTCAKVGRYDDTAAAFGRAIVLRPQSEKFRRNLKSLGKIGGGQPSSLIDSVWQSYAVSAFEDSFLDGFEIDLPENEELARDALDIVFDEWE